jgi:hypothetical protein
MTYPSPSDDRAGRLLSVPTLPARARGATAALAGLFLLLVVAVYADPLFARRNFAGRDPFAFHYPLEKAIHDAYARGRLPVWISEISGGRPLLANPNVGGLYPIRPALSRFSFPMAMRLFPILHWAGAGIGVILLLRVLDVSLSGAWIGAVTYAFAGASVSYVFYPNSHPGMALLPWIVWGIARPAGGIARGALVLSFCWTLILLAGDVFPLTLALLGSLLWILLETEPGQRTAAFTRLAVALGLAGLAAAPQILASALWIPETNRAVLGMRLNEVILFSISPFRLLELIIPFPFGTAWELDRTQMWGWPLYHNKQLGYFSGLYAGAFAAIALGAMWKARRAGARFARALFLVGLAISVPPSLFPAGWGDLRSPVPLRFPEKFAVSLALAMAVFAGLAFDSFRRDLKVRWPLWAGAALAVLASLAALFPGACGSLAVRSIGADSSLAKTAGEQLPGALAEAGLLWMATVLALEGLGHGTRRALAGSLALLTLVPIAANRKIARTFPEQSLFASSPFDRFLQRADPDGAFRTLDESSYAGASRASETDVRTDVSGIAFARRTWSLYTHALWGRGTVFNGDLDSGDLSRLESLRRISYVAAGYRDSQAFFGALALRWGIRLRDQEALPGYHPIHSDALVYWDEHRRAFPDIRLAGKWREETDAVSAWKTVRELTEGEIVIESGSRAEGSARPGRLRVIEKTPERLVIETMTPDPTWLFVLRAYWTHRTVLLDGSPIEDVPAQLAFSAVAVPAGRHRIEWREDVPGASVSRWGTVLFAIAAAGILARGGSKRGRSSPPDEIR